MSVILTTPAVITVYSKGTKQRKVVGLPGAACHKATVPYEAREIAGQMKKTPTGYAYLDSEDSVRVEQQVKGEINAS